jgi:3-phenylpropionate/trans-cinnamate dioxygenase ferredoxin reductase subunit
MSDTAAQGDGIVIVGAGQAGVTAAESLRAGGFAGPLALLGDEPHGPYHRPPLSKAWLAGAMDAAQLVMRAPQMLANKGIVLRTGVRVAALDRAARQVLLHGGERLAAGRGVLLATGAAPRRLPLAGADAPNVHVLRSRDEASALAAALDDCAARGLPLVVIGGGFIGLEVAATARKKGLAVTVLEAAPRLLARMLTPELSGWFEALHRGHGVDVRCGVAIGALQAGADGRIAAVQLADGSAVPCGAVLLGVGAQAHDALAREAGIACDRGVIVDAQGRTSDPWVVAAGDCTARRLADGTLLRLESVQGATEGAKAAAATLLGQARPFTATPWFWSDQYDRKLQMAGLAAGADRHVLRGSMHDAAFSLWHYRGEQLVAVDTVNAAKDHLLARKLLDAGVSPTPAQVADTDTDLAAPAAG